MRQPQHLSHEQQRQCDRLQDVGSALAAVRKAAAGGDRLAIQRSSAFPRACGDSFFPWLPPWSGKSRKPKRTVRTGE
jgi:hypothetical protein